LGAEMFANVFLDAGVVLAQEWPTKWSDGGVFKADDTYTLTSMGLGMKVYTAFAQPNLCVNSTADGVRYFASVNPTTKEMTVWFVNHTTTAKNFEATISNFVASATNERWRLTSPNNDPQSTATTLTKDGSVTLTKNGTTGVFSTSLPPVSVTAVVFASGSSTTPPTTSADLINSFTAPASVTPGTNATVTVNYSASTNRDVIVVFQKDNGDYSGYGSGRADVTSGNNKTVTITVPIAANTPIANDNYQFQVMISPDDTDNTNDYPSRLNNKAQIDVDATSSFTLTNNAIYRLKSVAGDVYLNSTGNSDFSSVGVAALNADWGSEKWKIENIAGTNMYKLRDNWGAKYLNSASNANGGAVNVVYSADWASQKWILEQVSGNTYRLKNNWGNKYLNTQGTTAGSSVVVADGNANSNNQKWILELVSSAREDENTFGIDNRSELANRIILFPNPTDNTFTISGVDTSYSYVLYNIQGQIVKQKESQDAEKDIDVSELPSGIYNMKIITTNYTITKKVIISK
jgi:hypothetical protein